MGNGGGKFYSPQYLSEAASIHFEFSRLGGVGSLTPFEFDLCLTLDKLEV